MDNGNNFNNGYPQQGYPQQQMQGGYPQQQMQGGYAQQQMQQSAPQQSRPQAKPPKKSNTGLIIGIIVASMLLVLGTLLFIFKDKLFGKKIAGGCDTPDKLMETFWTGYSECDKDKLGQCFLPDDDKAEKDIESNYQTALAHKDNTTIKISQISTTYAKGDKDDITGVSQKIKEVKTFHMEVPMTQVVNGVTYEVNDIYEGYILKLENDKWYLCTLKEVDVQIVDYSYDDDDWTEEDTQAEVTEEVTEETTEVTTEATTEATGYDTSNFLGADDLKTMGYFIDGYIDVPSDWVDFYEEGGIDAYSSTQFSSPDKSSIITMVTYEEEVTPEQAATNIYNTLSQDSSCQDVTSASVTIGNYPAKQVYCYYPDEDIYLVTYFFTGDDNRLHYVAVEFPTASANIVYNVEKSFRFDY